MTAGFDPSLIMAVVLAAGYLLGSIPFGLVLTKMAGLGDIRAVGSGNIGATNVLRTGNKGLAAATLLLDGGKGAAAALLAQAAVDPAMGVLAGVGAVIGHNFPIWLRFKGGKGVATTLGTLIAVAWPVGLLACATWLVVAALTRFSSLAALVALGVAPIYAYFLAEDAVTIAAAFLSLLAIVRHQANIRRLLAGTETRIGAKKA